MRLIALAAASLLAAHASATLPLAFEERGAQYVARGAGYSMTIANDGAWTCFRCLSE